MLRHVGVVGAVLFVVRINGSRARIDIYGPELPIRERRIFLMKGSRCIIMAGTRVFDLRVFFVSRFTTTNKKTFIYDCGKRIIPWDLFLSERDGTNSTTIYYTFCNFTKKKQQQKSGLGGRNWSGPWGVV